MSQRWPAQPLRGELLGFSASVSGELVGMLIAERCADADGKPAVEVISLFVLPAYRKRGIAARLHAHLHEATPDQISTPGLKLPFTTT